MAAPLDFFPPHDERRGQRRIVGICGVPGSGKSTLAQWLVDALNARDGEHSAAYLPMDGFHFSNRQLEKQGSRQQKGAPHTFDAAGYVELLRRLRRDDDATVYAPSYSRELHEPVANDLAIPPETNIVVTEGNYLLLDEASWEGVARELDAAWYLDASTELVRERLIERQVAGGKTPEDARRWFESVDLPNIEKVRETRGRGTHTVTALGDMDWAVAEA